MFISIDVPFFIFIENQWFTSFDIFGLFQDPEIQSM